MTNIEQSLATFTELETDRRNRILGRLRVWNALDQIALEEHRWNQKVWYRIVGDRLCDTEMCLAGWMCDQDEDTRFEVYSDGTIRVTGPWDRNPAYQRTTVAERALDLLGLTDPDERCEVKERVFYSEQHDLEIFEEVVRAEIGPRPTHDELRSIGASDDSPTIAEARMSVHRVYHHVVADGPIPFSVAVNLVRVADSEEEDGHRTYPELVIYLENDRDLENIRVVDTGGDTHEFRPSGW